MFDILVPKNNELVLVDRLKVLGFDSVILLYYDLSSFEEIIKKYSNGFFNNLNFDLKIKFALVVNKINDLSKFSKYSKYADVLSVVDLKNFNPDVLSSKKIDIIINSVGEIYTKYVHTRVALNHVSANYLSKNNILVSEKVSENYFRLTNFIQNIFLSSKFKFRIAFFSFAESVDQLVFAPDLKSYSLSFGLKHFTLNKSYDISKF